MKILIDNFPQYSTTTQADVLVDVECDSKHLDHVVRRLKREGRSGHSQLNFSVYLFFVHYKLPGA